MPSITLPVAIAGAGALTAAGGVASGVIGAGAAKNAAAQEANAANQGTQLQRDIFNQTQSNLSPFIGGGTSALTSLQGLEGIGPQADVSNSVWNQVLQERPDVAANYQALVKSGVAQQQGITSPQQYAQVWYQDHGQKEGYKLPGVASEADANNPLNSPLLKTFAPTEANLITTPGYQWNLSQGLKSVQSAAAARGLGLSGAALKGAATYATGLADSTFNTQANNFYTGQQNALNALSSQAGLGENAAAGQGNIGASTGANIAGTTVGAGQAAAAGTIGAANAITGGLSGATGSLTNLLYANKLFGSLGGGSSGAGGMYAAAPGLTTGQTYI